MIEGNTVPIGLYWHKANWMSEESEIAQIICISEPIDLETASEMHFENLRGSEPKEVHTSPHSLRYLMPVRKGDVDKLGLSEIYASLHSQQEE
jgi:hypothetical protein